MALTTYPGILASGTMDRRAPAITTSTAMNRRFAALSIVDQVCRVRGSELCQPFRTGAPVLFLCSPISGSSAVNNHCELTNLSGIRYYRSPNWSKARESSCFISIPYDEGEVAMMLTCLCEYVGKEQRHGVINVRVTACWERLPCAPSVAQTTKACVRKFQIITLTTVILTAPRR
jgi:hypothetical protein